MRTFKTKINKFFLFLLILLMLPVVFAEQPLNINVKIIPRGPTSIEENVIGDTFSYEIELENPTNNSFNFDLICEIYTPLGLYKTKKYPTMLFGPITNKTIFPLQEDNKTLDIYPFNIAGPYKLKLISNENVVFYQYYSLINSNGEIYHYSNWNKFPKSFEYYFEAMPQWQYKLTKKQKEASEKQIEANDKLLKLTVRIKNSTLAMLFVALVALLIAIVDVYHNEKVSRSWKFALWLLVAAAVYIIYISIIS